ncbi:hypothetical protein ACIHJG_00120 [Streptomyces sp. NPDC052415]|uniref:hypothetical protein n=1 Tax=unclassified Streptomyces TaxID=2593676 RepID=UPI0020223D1D|nr:hypothetical protein [Streptomyces sp. YS415]MCL7424042.1 hypothetical protein [Streptomyces sp. YS415]
MRLPRSLAPVTVAVALLVLLPYEATPQAREPEPFGSECRTRVQGSHVIAYCHNPYADADRVRLHIECSRWWDLDTDSSPVDTGPAATVRLTGRCWKEVRTAWVSHQQR